MSERLLGILRRSVHLGLIGARRGYQALCHGRALLRWRGDWIAERWPGEQDLAGARRIAVFMHYDRRGLIHRYARHYLDELRRAGYVVLFVSNAPRLPAGSLDLLRPICGLILRRDNVGYDFGAYKDAIAQIPDLARLDSLIVANDSVYGPFRPLPEVVRQADPATADVWGITDSWERRYHLQTYFLLFFQPALAHPAFAAFWRSLRYVQSKGFIIRRYEVGLSTALLAGGLRLRALYPYRETAGEVARRLAEARIFDEKQRVRLPHGDFLQAMYNAIAWGRPLNPTHFFWDHLLLRMGCPFLKRELLTRNPANVPRLQYWDRAIREIGDYDPELIVDHLQRTLRDRSV